MTDILNRNPLDYEYLTTHDVTMEPQEGVVEHRASVNVDPFIYSAPMDSVTGYELAKAMIEQGEYAVVSRFISKEERLLCVEKLGARTSRIFFAIGLDDDEFLNDCKKYTNILNVALDIAHGDMGLAHRKTKELSKLSIVDNIMSGSICTPQAARRAATHGCTHLRVGVGPGAVCTTRLMTGVGMPQLSAVYRVRKSLQRNRLGYVHVIADGGIKNPGDAAKYLAAGARGIMMGSAFSKCRESPGWEEGPYGHLHKTYRGQASASFQKSRYNKAGACPEGTESKPFVWDGDTVESTVNKYKAGVQSACSYLGLHSTDQMNPNTVTFRRVTPSGYYEGTPHGA